MNARQRRTARRALARSRARARAHLLTPAIGPVRLVSREELLAAMEGVLQPMEEAREAIRAAWSAAMRDARRYL